jgi:TPR repeat protein
MPQDLLPSKIITRFRKDKKIESTNEEVFALIQTLITNNSKSDKELLSLISKSVKNPNDWEKIAFALTVHTEEGKIYGSKLFKLAGLNGSKDAEFQYAELIGKGFISQPRNPLEALKIVKKIAAQKHIKANYVMAMDSIKRKSYTEALYYLREASNLGYGPAEGLLGSWYAKGINVPINLQKGFELLEKAHLQKIPDATANLSEFYISGKLIKKDRQRAFELLKEAACQGVPIAQHNLAEMYFDKEDIPTRNLAFAVEYWKMAAAQNFVISVYALGKLCQTGYKTENETIPVDVQLAIKNFTKIVNLGGNADLVRESKIALDSLSRLLIPVGLKNRIE